ncbi:MULTISPECIES: hypothetical protein [unclassified Caballeronia]|uniref:hypothetical protein n=1 Tax=unclassified Caballeronia TaxID=2646786 RepID=UPI002027DE06|nr:MULTISPECIES: hypothetical protein [unclassified Caballeronia]MDR5765893.1 hypothetical protein [Caballeronia sp. LZ028]
MDDLHEIREAGPNGDCGFARGLPARLLELLEVLVTDVASDVEVVARELGLRDEMRERLRRAFDRVECALGVLEAMQKAAVTQSGRRPADVSAEEGGCGGRDVGASEDHGRDDALDAMERVRGAVELLAGEWPQDYPEQAVEWCILEKVERSSTGHTSDAAATRTKHWL